MMSERYRKLTRWLRGLLRWIEERAVEDEKVHKMSKTLRFSLASLFLDSSKLLTSITETLTIQH